MKEKINYFYNPVRVIQGNGCVHELPALAEEILPHGGNILWLAWSESVFELEVCKELKKNNAYEVRTICFNESNPTVGQLFAIYQETKEFAPRLVVATGGGSVMDVGKSLCCIYGKEIQSEDELRIMIAEKAYGNPEAKWIGMPTTAGTGSEVTCWATIWDPEKNAKRSVESKENYAYAALVDPDLLKGIPVKLAVSSALDAVAHAAESYWAKASNLVSREFALGAIRMIMRNTDQLMDCGKKEAAMAAMAKGSMMAGMAFSNTKTTACHSISYPLTMQYQIPHGTAVSMLLAPVLRINSQGDVPMEPLFEALGVKDAEELELRIRTIMKHAGIPSTLKEWKVPYEQLPTLAALGITKGRADNNPVELDTDRIVEILKTIY